MRVLPLCLLVAVVGAAACGHPAASQPPPVNPNDPMRPLSPAECTQAVDHVLGFTGATPEEQQQIDMLKGQRDRMIAQCGTEGRKKDLDCLMGAKTLQELGGCEEPGGGQQPPPSGPAPAPAPQP